MPESGERARFSRSAFFRQSPRAVLPEKTRRRVCRCLAYGSTCSHHCPFSVPCSSRNQSQQEEEEYNTMCVFGRPATRTARCSAVGEGIPIMPPEAPLLHLPRRQDVAGFLPCGQLARSRESPGSPFGRHAVPT